MKTIRTIAGKFTALAVALFTTVSLLNPYQLKAGEYPVDYYVDPYDWEAEEDGSGNGGCGFVQESFTCSSSTAVNYQNNGSGNLIKQWSTAFGYAYPAQLNLSFGSYNSNLYVYQNIATMQHAGTYVMKCIQRGYGIRECQSEACPGQSFQPAVQKCPGARCR